MSHYAKQFFPLRFATTGSQLVTNGNFDANITGWTKTGTASTLAWNSGTGGDGTTGFMRMTVGTTTAWDRFYQSNAGVVVNARYQLTFWYRTTNITGYFWFFTAQTGNGYTYYTHHAVFNPSTSWTKAILIFKTSTNSSYPNYPYFGFTKNGTIGSTGATIDFDQISLIRLA